MKFKVNKIAAAVAVGLGTSVVGMNVAQADELLFPNMVTSNAVTTILSVINNDDRVAVRTLHYRYYYKTDDVSKISMCEEVNYNQPTSPNDIVTFDIGGVFGDSRGVLFEPARTKAVYDKDFAVFRNLKPVRAFGMVDNTSQGFFPGANIEGEAFIIEFAQGSVWGYEGYNSADILGSVGGAIVKANPFDFSDRVENNGEVMVEPGTGLPVGTAIPADRYWVPMAVMPWAGNIQTALFVTPVATDQRAGTWSTNVQLAVIDPGNTGLDVMYDRDENPYSGRRGATVTCVARIEVKDLITAATQQFLKDSGGWTHVIVSAPNAVQAPPPRLSTGQAVVMKLEYNDKAPATIDGKPSGSESWNNSIWLRRSYRESVPRIPFPGAPANVTYIPTFDVPSADELNSPYPLVYDAAAKSAGLPWPPLYGADATPYATKAACGKQ